MSITSTKRTLIARTARSTALAIARAMLDKKATDVLILQVAPLTSVADYLVIGSADSDRQASAIADHADGILSRSGSKPLSVEGTRSSQWVLMDYGDVIAHIFRQDVRKHYALERLWADAKRIAIPGQSAATQPAVTPQPVKRKKAPAKIRA
ncbi:MAG TPA: ribosome silencing factor [Nitrospiraceae bacterium]|nr:ribosome silencing factor [Nitrospiraceae bacterium]